MGDFAAAVSKIKPKGVVMDATPELSPGKIIYRDCTKEEVKQVASWFTNAKVRAAEVTLRGNTLVWIRGTWIDGDFNGGYWVDGTWEGGKWLNGIWRRGTWEGGKWVKGFWKCGSDKDGKFHRNPPPWENQSL